MDITNNWTDENIQDLCLREFARGRKEGFVYAMTEAITILEVKKDINLTIKNLKYAKKLVEEMKT